MSSTTDPLKGAMIGAGFFAGFQAEAWRRVPGARVTAVADVDLPRAQAFAAKWGIPRAYGDAAEMLEAERPAFVDIATRPESHRALCDLAAARGVHVICQKPLAPSWEESVAIARAFAGPGATRPRLLVHENWRWQPWYRVCRRILDEGTLGRLFHIGFRMRTGDGRGPTPYSVQPYFRDMPRLLIYETAVHYLDTFRFLAGEIERVFCQTARINPVIRGEDCALVTISFVSGAHGLIDGNRLSGVGPSPVAFGEMTIECERGTLRVSPDGRLLRTPHGADEAVVELPPPTGDGYKGDSVFAVQAHMVECLRAGRPAESEVEDYLRTVAAVFACYQSAETGRPIAPTTLAQERGSP